MKKVILFVSLFFAILSNSYSQEGLVFQLFQNPDVPNGQVRTILAHGDTVFVGGSFYFWGPPIGPFGVFDTLTGDVDLNMFRVIRVGNYGITKLIPDNSGGFYMCSGGGFIEIMEKSGTIRKFNGILHVNSDGSIDLNFNPPPITSSRNDYNNLLLVDTILFAVGNFTKIGDSIRTYIAAFDARTGRILPWKTDSIVTGFIGIRSIAIIDTILIVGGDIQKVGDSTRNGIAAF
ncbi:MAG: hypothetical protein ABDI07_08955, partial [Candidatus Kryptonium sp.]